MVVETLVIFNHENLCKSLQDTAFFHCLDVLYQHATLPTRPKSPQINTDHGKV